MGKKVANYMDVLESLLEGIEGRGMYPEVQETIVVSALAIAQELRDMMGVLDNVVLVLDEIAGEMKEASIWRSTP